MRILIVLGLLGALSAQAPSNDDCANASLITIDDAGYQYGTFYSDTVNIANATLQAGEYFPPGVPNGKSVWYKFFLPTTRSVRIILREDGASIPPTKAGWTLYATNTCLPNASQKVDPPIVQMEGYTHECLRRGWYLVQVGIDLTVTTGKIFLEIITSPSSAPESTYDLLANAQNLGVLNTSSSNTQIRDVSWEAGCQGLHKGERICENTLPRDSSWSKSSWHVFRTDSWIDWLGISLEESPWDNSNSNPRIWRINLYRGNAKTDSASLVLIDSCISLTQYTSGVPARKDYLCSLEPNTWYSMQILYPTNYFGNVRLKLFERGINPTASPNPLTIPSTHDLGTLGVGTYSFSDVLACNARISLNRCGTIAGADTIDGYDLNLWYKFTLSAPMDVEFGYNILWYDYGGDELRFRLFSGDPATDGCNLPLVDQWDGSGHISRCLPAGTYVVQVLGKINRSYAWVKNSYYGAPLSNLGVPVNYWVKGLSAPQQHFGLHSSTEVDLINNGLPLVSGTTYWTSRDTFDCRTTVLPAGDVCGAGNNRASYRIVQIDQSGILSVGDQENCGSFNLRIYRGDARTEPIVNGRIQNLVDQVGCQRLCWWEPVKVCVTPGTYTIVTFGDDGDKGRVTRHWVRFDAFPPTLFTDPLASDPNPPENMDTLSPANPSITATATRFSCIDNPNTILGYPPCNGATKLIYREIYIAQPSLVTFTPHGGRHPNAYGDGSVVYRTFRGRISNNTLTSLYKDCHGGFTACMDPGWYTIVAYGYPGGTYTNPTYTSGRGGVIGNLEQFTISMDLRVQKFGTFATADRSYSGDPGRDSIRWYNTGTATVPLNHKSYGFDQEFWSCANNLPFPSGITSCNPSDNRISYRVFQLTRPSYVIIYGSGYFSSMRLYQGDITQTAPPYTIVHDCSGSPMRICWLPPGKYTLVTFASDAHIGRTFTPSIYVDSVGYSFHDWATAAYDFGEIPPDNTEYRTAPSGNPDPLGRPGSTDFIFCTTTAHASNPSSNCPLGDNWPTIPYTFPDNLASNYRRNLWYTFTVTGPGRVYITVENKTSGGAKPAFSVYESDDVNFPTVVDSTLAMGLQLVATSQYPWWWGWCCSQYSTVSFYREPCYPQPKKRYYIVVNRNTCGKEPNLQIEVGIRFDPAPTFTVKYDHYSTANEITGDPTTICDGPYPGASLPEGTYRGCQGDLSCATKDSTDQNTCGTHTIWYKFTPDVTGYVYLNYDHVGVQNFRFDEDDIQLYHQVIPGDSTSGGLARMPLTGVWETHPTLGNRYWGRSCVVKGQTYYIMITGCNHLGLVVPRIWLRRHEGDYCTDSLLITVSGSGTYSAQTIIDCFTIGEAPGENDTLIGCMGSPIGQKSMWVLVHNQTPDTMDFDIEIEENTTALGPQIRYRILTGDCSAMNQEECVQEGAYIQLHLKCRPPLRSFWVQVLMPSWATGTVKVKVTANPISQRCRPADPDCPVARFDQIVGCPDEPVQFLNYSSVGPNVSYWWDFGDGFTSSLFAPQHSYSAPDTYLVRLVVDNGVCKDTSRRFLIIYPKPSVSVTYTPPPIWVGMPITFNPTYTDTAGAVIYWDFCAGTISPWCTGCGASMANYVGATPPPVSYNCSGEKKICIQVSNAGVCDTVYCFEVEVKDLPIFVGGPYDGAAEGYFGGSCPFFSYVGGPYDGAAEGYFGGSCSLNYAGGPYDGAAEGFIGGSCSLFSYVGGPYDGAAEGYFEGSCPLSYAGGPYDGAAEGFIGGSCSLFSYVGGPYDGAAEGYLRCPPDWFTGGPYDGAAEGYYGGSCPPLFSYVGGPYDGAAEGFIGGSCSLFSYVGGPYDGAAEGYFEGSCPLSYAGGPYDGAAEGFIGGSCSFFSYVGGPYDGAAEGYFGGSCPLSYAGGPYDGAAEGYSGGSCSLFSYVGGPYDGTAEGFTGGTCPLIYAGGPYDGAAEGYYNSSWVRDTVVCSGQAAALVASTPSDWYTTPTGGTPVATNTNVLNLGPITSSQIYYVQNACTPSRILAVAIAQPKLQAAFVYSPTSPDSACVGQPVYFSNQTLVSGPSQPSLGSLIVGLSSPGAPPPMGYLSFSSQQTANFSLLANGVHDGGNAWTAGNAGASTQWVQWYYAVPRSVNRIVFWNCTSCPNAANRMPVYARLYYNQGAGWKLAKVFPGPLSGNFDSGIFYETQGVFAQRWKLELDVVAPNAPAWGEFQVYCSAPVTGGTVQWNFGDSSPWASGGNISHTYTAPGTYTVTQVVNAPGACPDTLMKTVEIRPCTPLSTVQVQLAGSITPKATIALQWQTNFPIRWARLEKLIEGQWRSIYEHMETTQRFGYEDTMPLFGEPNVYRVFSVHENGAQLYSNVVSFTLDKAQEPFVRVFPNPVQDILNIQFGLPQDGEVSIAVYDAKGAKIREIPPQKVSKGLHQWNLETYFWSTGIYFIQVELDGKTYSPRVLKIYP